VAWRIVAFEPGAALSYVTVMGDRLIATGTSDGGPAAWFSDDGGLGWTRSDLVLPESPAEGAFAHLGTLVATSDRVVVSGSWFLPDGSGDFPPFLLLSEDGGSSWVSTDVDDELLGPFDVIEAGDAGFIGVGFERTGTGLWTSRDGEAWGRLEATGIDGQPQSFAVSSDGRGVAVGFFTDRQTPAFWWSRDLLAWEAVAVDEGDPGLATGVVALAGGYVAGGLKWLPEQRQQDSWAVVWLSNDGRSWLEVPITEAGGWQVSDLAAGEAGVLADIASTVRSDERLVFVPSGTTSVSSSVAIPFRVTGLVALPDGFVAVGRCNSDPCGGSFVAIGTLSESADSQDPTLPPQASASPSG
jgi:hypothetical protein